MPQAYLTITILAVTMALFIRAPWRYDIVAIMALSVSVLAGVVPFNQVYSGLENPAVITVACVMIISHVMTKSNIFSVLIDLLAKYKKYPRLHISLLSILVAILSAFMNNIGALAMIMPIAIKTSIDSRRSPSLILMPLALSSALGGLITMIGTPPNLLISMYRQEVIGKPYNLFSFSPVGLCVAFIGVLFIILIGWKLIPVRKAPKQIEEIFKIEDYITEVKIPKKSPAIGLTRAGLERQCSCDFMVIGRIRNKKKKFIFNSNDVFEEGDIIIVEASAKDLNKFIEKLNLELVGDKHVKTEELKSNDVMLMEAVIAQNSRSEGKTSQQLRFRSKYRMNLLAISREGKSFKKRLNQVKLKPGDVLLLQGVKTEIDDALSSLGFLPLISRNVRVSKQRFPLLAPLIFLASIILTAMHVVPVQLAFSGAIVLMIICKVIKPSELYVGIEWPIITLLAAMIPIGNALQTSGATTLITDYFLHISTGIAPAYILLLLLIVTMTLSDFINNAATTIVMAPIAVGIAKALSLNIDPFLMTVAVGASCSFLTPIGHQNNTLVMGPGGYKFTDYIRIGLPLEIIIAVISIPLILMIWPLY